jgi:ketosteroid isomerase-like protein
MKLLIFKSFFLLLLLGGGLCAMAQTTATKIDSLAIVTAIRKVNTAYGDAFLKGDSSLLLSSYTPDACIMPPNSPAICGSRGHLAFFKAAYRSGIRDIKFTTVNLFGLTAQYATEQGTYEMFGAGNLVIGHGKYLVLWKKTASGWQMFRDMFSDDTPPPRAAK